MATEILVGWAPVLTGLELKTVIDQLREQAQNIE